MKTGRSLRHLSMRDGARASGRRRHRSAGTVTAGAARLLLVPAIALVGLGTAAAASPGHGVSGRPVASARGSVSRPCAAGATVTRAPAMPWMYAVVAKMPWMYAITPTPAMPWMYAVTPSAKPPKAARSPRSPQMPWMYASSGSSPAGTACASSGTAAGRA